MGMHFVPSADVLFKICFFLYRYIIHISSFSPYYYHTKLAYNIAHICPYFEVSWHAFLRKCALCWSKLPNLQDMLGPDQGYDGMYGQGPPSVHSSHGGRGYQPQGNL